jgi:tRNA nucleotidyltransferase (CCA-adding enzyme)
MRLDGNHYGELHDYWGGLADLHAGIVRVLHSLSFVDDPTRILRAVRFEQRFGYKIGERTLELLTAALPLLDKVSGDRLRHEFNNIFQEPNAIQMMMRLAELDIFQAIHEDIPWDESAQARVEQGLKNTPEPIWGLEEALDGYPLKLALVYTLWLAILPSAQAASILGRLRVPGWLAKIILAASNHYHKTPIEISDSPSEVVIKLDDLPPLALYVNFLLAEDKEVQQKYIDYATKWQEIQPNTTGHDLRARGIPPGPEYSRILDTLRAAWLDGQVSSHEQENILLEKLIND